MKKILQIVDTYDWAIGTLAKNVIKGSPHFDWRMRAIHPKDLEQGKVSLGPIIEDIKWADCIDAQYWRTLSQLLDKIPELKEKPIFLTHQNEKNLLSYDWPSNIIHVTTTKYSESLMKERYPDAVVHYVPNSFNHHEFKWNPDYPPSEKVVGYVGRIVPWKGLKDIAKACFELGYPLQIMGKMDKPSYFAEIPQEHRENMRWDFFNCDDTDRMDFYKNITIYVGNSGSGRETGPLGLIEAMAVGVPCVSTPAGIATDIGIDDENMLLVDYDDYDGLKMSIERLMESPTLQQRFRKSAWDTIRGYNGERRGMIVRTFFNKLFYKNPLVSVIIPTTPDKLDQTHEILKALEESTYKDIEAVVVFDQSSVLVSDPFRVECRSKYSFAVKVLHTGQVGNYSLAIARNLGVIEADGEYIMLCDNRMRPDANSISEFLKVFEERPDAKVWLFGEKGGEKMTFVENFSMIRRGDLIKGGMFNERITKYGGMSQELRARFSKQGYEFGYVKNAKATQLCKSSLSPQKRDGIIDMKNLLWKLNLN